MSVPNSSSGASRTRSGRKIGTQEYSDIQEQSPSPNIVEPNNVEANFAKNTLPLPNVNAPIDPATFQQHMLAMMNLLTQSVANQNRQPTPVAIQRPQEPKVKDPETFTGQRDSLNSFITKCELVFERQPSRFGDDRTRVSYMISLLQGTPLLAVRPLLSFNPRPIFLDNHWLFIQYLQTNYGDPDEKGTARRKLKSLQQTGPALAYFAEFQQYIALLGWLDQDPIIDKAIDGLKPFLKDKVAQAGHRPSTLSELIAFIVPLDNRLYKREQEKRHETRNPSSKPINKPKTSHPTATTTSVTSATFTPRSNNFAKQKPAYVNRNRPNGGVPRGPLTNAEKQRRRDANLCLYCGEGGHIANDCPLAQARNATTQVKFKTQQEPQGPPLGNAQGSTK